MAAQGTGHDEVPPPGTNAWYVRGAKTPNGFWRVRCHLDDRHPDGRIIPDPGPLSGVFVLWEADVDQSGRPVLSVSPKAAPGAPPVWFVALHEPSATPAAVALVAFATGHRDPGTVVPDAEFFHLPVRNDEQVGAIRWWPDEAVVDQVFVRRDMRRTHLATVLIYAASAFHQFNGWPGRLHSDGRRTTLGESLVAGLRHPQRIASLTSLMPSMDPDPDPSPDDPLSSGSP